MISPEYNKADLGAAANAARYAYSGRHREFNNAVERILKACPMNDRNTIETNLRILAIQEGHSLDDSVDALILAGGDRERAGQFLRSGTSSSMNTFASQASSFEQSQPEYNKPDHEAAANAARYPYSGRHQEFNNAVERILKECPMNDRNTIETNLRILHLTEEHSLEESVDALIRAGGDRERASILMKREYKPTYPDQVKIQEFNNAVERILNACPMNDRNTIVVDLQILTIQEGHSLDDSVDALICANGNRERAAILMKRGYIHIYPDQGMNQEFNNAVERISKACPMNDLNVIETNLRILTIQEGHSLEESVDALIRAGGDRERAGQFLRSGTSSSMNTFASQGHDPSHFS
ncbi:hypothetical protein Aperf_G00000068401 [Anoplocephala perfoliata]